MQPGKAAVEWFSGEIIRPQITGLLSLNLRHLRSQARLLGWRYPEGQTAAASVSRSDAGPLGPRGLKLPSSHDLPEKPGP